MERVAHKARSFVEAENWDRKQYQAMTPVERMRVARESKKPNLPWQTAGYSRMAQKP
jgi:hypothetical protein